MTDFSAQAAHVALHLSKRSLEDRLRQVAEFDGSKVFTTSLGIEDQVVTAAIARSGAAINVVTLDTGRLFPQTAALIEETEARYGIRIERFHPADDAVADYAARYGRDGFYESVEARHACCDIRKLRPLGRALSGAAVWLTGVRRGQSGARAQTPLAEYDGERGLLKVNPLADMSLEEIKLYAETHAVPLNPLHACGYPSIGCEPCTRAIKPGEPERAGRWWWEQDQTRECGLHVKTASSTSSLATQASIAVS